MTKHSFFIASGCPIVTTTRYRCIHLKEQLSALGHRAEVAEWFTADRIDPAAAAGYDVIVLYRLPLLPALQDLISSAHDGGKRIIFDTDDLIFAPDLIEWHRGVQRLNATERKMYADDVGRYLATLKAADFVTTATPILTNLARERGAIAYTHRNSLGNEMLALTEKLYQQRSKSRRRDKVIIGYGSGTPTHDIDFKEASLALADILNSYKQVELWIVGPLELPDELVGFDSRIQRFSLTDWRVWFELAATMDIALAPLEMDNIFCQAKSEIKFVESGAVGVPLVASDTGAVREAIEHGKSGLLASNRTEWYEALSSLVQDVELRSEMGRNARDRVLSRYSPAARTKELASLLENLTSGSVR